MKQIFLLLLSGMITIHVSSQSLFSYGRHSVSIDEFQRAYNKNKITFEPGKNDLKEYLDLYILFKQKVQEAKDMHLDTLPALQADLQNFKMQIAQNYMYDRKEMDSLVNQARERSKKDIRVISYKIQPATPGETDKIKPGAEELYNSLSKTGKYDEKDFGQKGINVTKEDLGYVTVFTLPYEIENIIYGLSTGAYSSPFKFGDDYYIFYKQSERPAVGMVKVAQILIAFQPDGKNEAKAKQLADSLYQALNKGADFEELAKKFSDDRNSYFRGGEIPEFGVGKYTLDFENRAFALKNDGDISAPFRTGFGYHILKRISATPVPEKDNEEVMYYLKQNVLQDERSESAYKKLLDSATLKTGFNAYPVDMNDLFKVTDTSLWSNRMIQSGGVNQNTILFTFNDGTNAKVSDWDLYLRNSGKVWTNDMHQAYSDLWPEYKKASILANYRKHLAEFDTSYLAQVREFEEGNLLFEIMQQKVWMKAAEDSAGLAEFYEKNKDRYKWKQSADVIMLSCSNKAIADEALKDLKHLSWQQIADKYPGNILADSARYEYESIRLPAEEIRAGVTKINEDRFDGTAVLVHVIKTYPAGLPMSFSDARGAVIDDYQKVLEDKWIEELKIKYPARINQRSFGTLLQRTAERVER
ncbi:MAG: peptidylprolyl isomerase [Chitinophagaceae bacterium]|nr:peptidylprolyl isomerase [Chitinophagaceae bacterium]